MKIVEMAWGFERYGARGWLGEGGREDAASRGPGRANGLCCARA
jgi:hypothetical protein